MARYTLTGLLLGMVGCTEPLPLGTTITPVGGGVAWEIQVRQSVKDWNNSLEKYCHTELFEVDREGFSVVYELPDRWQFGNKIGMHTNEAIYVLHNTNNLLLRAVLNHELGHAFGLDHILREDDPETLMYFKVSTEYYLPSEMDAEKVANNLECL